jgi:hypothetical protein
MASEVDICNLALGHFGNDAQVTAIDPPDGSVEAAACAKFYPIARDALLAMFDWTFARGRETGLAELTSPSSAYAYAYVLPTNIVRPVKAFMEDETDETGEGVKFAIEEGGLILSNEPIATLMVTRRVEDTNRYSPLFVTCLSWLLASYAAGPILKEVSRETADRMYKQFRIEYAAGTGVDANTGTDTVEHKPSWIKNR